MGPKTSAAIGTFRRSNGLPPGSIDAALKQALNIS